MTGFKPPSVSGSGIVTNPICVRLDNNSIEFYCPGCNATHIIDLNNFNWNGSMTTPTISQSIKVIKQTEGIICHSSLRNGKLQYHNESKHALSGQTIQLISF